MPSNSRIFKTNKRIRLGIWGLGRGMSFYKTCEALNMDVVAGCDFNPHMRERFQNENPGSWATDDASKFLAGDFDAVLLATFCPAHADDAIACLKAGKHVLSEVTAFHTMAEGVRLVEAVAQSRQVYNMVENYPFSAANMYLARKWKEGLFGELMYAEYEYVHEIRELLYSYIDGKPLNPGDNVHNWRSWLNFHYYNTHSLGPVMYITGTRPTRVVSLPGEHRLAGFLMHPRDGMGGVTPSLITMSNGGLVRNLMGATASDTHAQRLWGTRGAAEQVDGQLRLRLGGGGNSPKHEVIPQWDELGEQAAETGHSGGDFWVLYFFARQILEETPAPFDIYTAADCTIPGILAWRSQNENGKPYDVPDFRNKAERDAWRHDEIRQPRYDTKNGLFPKNANRSITTQFSATMIELVRLAKNCRAYLDWIRMEKEMSSPDGLIEIVNRVIGDHPKRCEIFPRAHQIANAYPSSDGARVLREMLSLAEDKQTVAPSFLKRLTQELAGMRRRYPAASLHITRSEASPLMPSRDIRKATPPSPKTRFSPIPYIPNSRLHDIRAVHGSKDGLVYIRAKVAGKAACDGTLEYGADGPVKVWVNGKEADCQPKATNPAIGDKYKCRVRWKKGANEVLFALLTNHGKAWGVIARPKFQ